MDQLSSRPSHEVLAAQSITSWTKARGGEGETPSGTRAGHTRPREASSHCCIFSCQTPPRMPDARRGGGEEVKKRKRPEILPPELPRSGLAPTITGSISPPWFRHPGTQAPTSLTSSSAIYTSTSTSTYINPFLHPMADLPPLRDISRYARHVCLTPDTVYTGRSLRSGDL